MTRSPKNYDAILKQLLRPPRKQCDPVSERGLGQLTPERERLVLDHMAFARNGALRYRRISAGRHDLDDYIGAAHLGLVEAAHLFDFDRGVQFTTFAFNHIDRRLKLVGREQRRNADGWGTTRDGSMRQHIQRVAWPTNEDGDQIEIGSCEDDPVADILTKQRRALVFGIAKNEKERAFLEALLSGKSLEGCGAAIGVSKQAAHQRFTRLAPRLKRLGQNAQNPKSR